MKNGICTHDIDCFARRGIYGKYYICEILTEAINNRECPFAKPDKEVTNGLRYPYSESYSKKDCDDGKEDG